MIPTKRSFSIHAILSLTTGKLLGDFGEMHELAEWVAGYPIWTHEFADKTLWQRLRLTVFAQHPALAAADADAAKINGENVAEYCVAFEKRFGKSLEIVSGTDERQESPMQSAERIVGADKLLGVVVPNQTNN